MEKLQAFVNSVKNGDNSHFLTIPPGPHDLSDLVMTSGIMQGGGGGTNVGGLGGLGTGRGTGGLGVGGTEGLGAGQTSEIGRAVQQECRDRSRMPSSA
eukprot:TRINITY_DN4683_c0_g1_i1.p1 TRINITY_DN4683_c0_g1~~TRINITY_DN4683_c0_g1_i1.p1  ORF type:complete len:110 (-),score=23.49 TRINITY_DN4683_c0_g1_i1:26-319(-)